MKIDTQYILTLLQLPKIGRKTAYKIINDLDHNISALSDLTDFVNEKVNNYGLPEYTNVDFDTAYLKAQSILERSELAGISVISFNDAKYPKLLQNCFDKPILLNYCGNIETLNSMPTVAVIGTREPTEFGQKAGRRLAEFLGNSKFNIVSGLAKGCDSCGHLGALDANGVTTAVLAHGLDQIYPKENRELAEKINEKGVLISEYFVGQRPMSNFFVERDRIQAGLSLGVLVIETGIQGGTMHTVKFCLDYRRILACLNHPEKYRKQEKVLGNQSLIYNRKAKGIYELEEVEQLVNDMTLKYNELHKDDQPVKQQFIGKKNQYRLWE